MEGKRKNINPGDLCGNDINRSQFRIFFIDILTIIPHTEFEATSRFISSGYMDLTDMEEKCQILSQWLEIQYQTKQMEIPAFLQGMTVKKNLQLVIQHVFAVEGYI